MKPVAVAVVLAVLALECLGADRRDDGANRVVHRSPREFPLLSKSMVRDLDARGCRISQPADLPATANVITGHFARAGQIDTAVLCSRHDESAIIVFWGGPARCPSELAATAGFAAMHPLPEIEKDEGDYPRRITAVDIHYIEQHRDWYGGPDPQGPPKDGIDDGVGMTSIVHYCVDGAWTELQGAD